MAPGLRYYTIIADGAEVADPASTAFFGGSKWASGVYERDQLIENVL
jgi:enterochelin esterase family protein